MRLTRLILASSLVFAAAFASSDAYAADKKKAPPKTTEADPAEPEPAAAKTAPPAESAPPAAEPGGGKPASAGPSDDGRFKIRRGLFAEGDLGLFLTFGGRNTNDPGLPSRSTSNVQPQLGVTVGYDLAHGETYNFSLGLRMAMGLNGGAGRVKEAEIAESLDAVTTKSSDYSVMEVGLQAGVSILMTDRLALTVKVDAGGGFLDPDPSTAAVHEPPCNEGETQLDNGRLCSVAGAGGAKFAPTGGAGVGVEYYTLLNDFSVGIFLRFQAILLDGMIPAATATVPIKYTF